MPLWISQISWQLRDSGFVCNGKYWNWSWESWVCLWLSHSLVMWLWASQVGPRASEKPKTVMVMVCILIAHFLCVCKWMCVCVFKLRGFQSEVMLKNLMQQLLNILAFFLKSKTFNLLFKIPRVSEKPRLGFFEL